MRSLYGSIDKEMLTANWNFKMASILKMATSLVEQLSDCLVGDINMKTSMSRVHLTFPSSY